MLEYFKTILSKVSFSKSLFEKELRKAIKVLVADELKELQHWCYRRFGQYRSIIHRSFTSAGISPA